MTTLALLEQPEVLTDELARRGQPGYRADQIWRWIYQRRATEFHAMTDLPVHLRAELADRFTILTTRVIDRQRDPDGTWKLLLRLADDERIECVLLRDEQGHRTACVSTQVGCAMGCVFCCSGAAGLVRNLTRGEILEQLVHLQVAGRPRRLDHVVVMGVGEPTANLDALLDALRDVTDGDQGFGIGARKITISTVGLPGGIRRLARADAPYHLAVSLHAADDTLRNRLIPVNEKIGIDAIIAAADEYFDQTGRRVTYEYIVLPEINDRPEDLDRLVGLLRGRPALLNLIPYNQTEGTTDDLVLRRPSAEHMRSLVERLSARGLTVTARRSKGQKVGGACGQLRIQKH